MNTTSIAPSLLNATVEDLRRHAPFSEMASAHLEWMAGRLQLAYYPSGTLVLGPEAGVPDWFYVLKQGSVEAGGAAEDSVIRLLAGECFPLGALLSERAVANQFRAAEDSFCYLLPNRDFQALLEKSAVFSDFCTRRIASLLEQSQKAVQAEYALRQEEDGRLERSLSELCVRTPVSVVQGTSLSLALNAMNAARVGSVAVTDSARHPVGILTLKDVLSRVTLPGLDLDTPIETVMSPDPVCLPVRGTAREALLAMARHNIHHVLIVNNGQLSGVLSEKDLFSLKRMSVQGITSAITHAADRDTLKQSGRDIASLAHSLLAQGVGAETLTELIATLNDRLTRRLIELETATMDLPGVRWCWIALGSEGRMEQTLATDQDNALIFTVANEASREAVRSQLLEAALRINNGLDACGFPLCKGGIMASNPRWCLSFEEWRAVFANWIHRSDATALLHATIFFDFRPLHGAAGLCDELRSWLDGSIKGNRLFLKRMAENALANRPPLGLVRDFVVSSEGEQANTLDLKLNGITPFVDAARIFALYAGIGETSTTARLRAAAQAWNTSPGEVEAWVAAFHFIQLLRLRHQHTAQLKGETVSNRIDPGQLNDLDRRILKEAFRQARKLQSVMGGYFEF